MATIEIHPEEDGSFQLSPACICCGKVEGIQGRPQTFSSSTAAQFLAIAPWFLLGPSLKTQPGLIFLALLASLFIVYAVTHRMTLSVPRCAGCTARRKKWTGRSGLVALFGALVLVGSCVLTQEGIIAYAVSLGILSLIISAVCFWLCDNTFGIHLLSRNSEVAKFRIPHQPM